MGYVEAVMHKNREKGKSSHSIQSQDTFHVRPSLNQSF
jgi:hypothetical protein